MWDRVKKEIADLSDPDRVVYEQMFQDDLESARRQRTQQIAIVENVIAISSSSSSSTQPSPSSLVEHRNASHDLHWANGGNPCYNRTSDGAIIPIQAEAVSMSRAKSLKQMDLDWIDDTKALIACDKGEAPAVLAANAPLPKIICDSVFVHHINILNMHFSEIFKS